MYMSLQTCSLMPLNISSRTETPHHHNFSILLLPFLSSRVWGHRRLPPMDSGILSPFLPSPFPLSLQHLPKIPIYFKAYPIRSPQILDLFPSLFPSFLSIFLRSLTFESLLLRRLVLPLHSNRQRKQGRDRLRLTRVSGGDTLRALQISP